ncbi:hypothetical protein GQ457_14G012500 [Hibiscus cannabinus]
MLTPIAVRGVWCGIRLELWILELSGCGSGGDFNAILQCGGKFNRPRFTWEHGSLSQRLDRCLCNATWYEVYPFSKISHLPNLGSDHRPILLITDQVSNESGRRPSRFGASFSWNREVFGHIERRRARLLARIRGVEKALDRCRSPFILELDMALRHQELARIIEESKEEQAQRRSKGIVIKEHN